MKILICGAGVIGSIYGVNLARAGHSVTMLARGQRLRAIEEDGIELENILTGERFAKRLETTETIHPAMDFDLAVITVRRSQIEALMPMLWHLPPRTRLLFMLNCPLRVGEILAAFGAGRTYFGFPGAGGIIEGKVVRYSTVRRQPTTFGPVLRQQKRFPEDLVACFEKAGFATATAPDMEGWLKTHAFLITAICGGLYRNGGISARLARDAAGLDLVIAGLNEGFGCLRSLGYTPSPRSVRLLVQYAPSMVLKLVLRGFLASELAALVIDGHANAAPDDMRDLADDCRTMMRQSGRTYPALSLLCDEIDRHAEAKLAGEGRLSGPTPREARAG